jgi:RNA polymerase sigma-70 factor, ECF subfamily
MRDFPWDTIRLTMDHRGRFGSRKALIQQAGPAAERNPEDHVLSRPETWKLNQGSPESPAPDLTRMMARYRNYFKMLADVRMGPWLQARVSGSDLVQETFLEATRDLTSFRGTTEEELLAWLKTILLNNVQRTIEFHVVARKRSVHRELSLDHFNDVNASSAAFDDALAGQIAQPGEQANRHELLVIVADCIAELSDEHRQMIVLRSLQGQKYETIAELTSRSEAACRMAWLRALEQLRKAFARRGLLPS